MFSSLWNFAKRHRRKFFVVGALTGGAYLALRYGQKQLREMQDKEAAECLAFARKQHHFDSNQRTCNMTVLSMLPTLREALIQAVDTESLTSQLKFKPANKVEIWEELKVLSFTRTICAVYGVGMVVVALRVQLNIIGGYIYVDRINTGDNQQNPEVVTTPEVQTKYLESIHYLLGQGLTDLIATVREAVTDVLRHTSLKEQLSLLDLQHVFSAVRQRVEFRQTAGYHDAATSSLCRFMMPPEDTCVKAKNRDEATLQILMKETRDMIESADFQSVLSTCLDTAFIRLVDKTAEYYRPSSADGPIVNPNDVRMALAKVIPVINGLVHTVVGDAPNQFVQELLLKDQMKDFAANIYEAFSEVSSHHTPL